MSSQTRDFVTAGLDRRHLMAAGAASLTRNLFDAGEIDGMIAIGGTMGYSYSAQVVEVSVDEETGVVTVDKVWVAGDIGPQLNRVAPRW